jgi:hypothetical protein
MVRLTGVLLLAAAVAKSERLRFVVRGARVRLNKPGAALLPYGLVAGTALGGWLIYCCVHMPEGTEVVRRGETDRSAVVGSSCCFSKSERPCFVPRGASVRLNKFGAALLPYGLVARTALGGLFIYCFVGTEVVRRQRWMRVLWLAAAVAKSERL